MTQTSARPAAGRSSSQGGGTPSRAAALRSWRSAVGLAAIAGGAAVIAGCLLPWASTFAGLISFPGIDGPHGRVLAAAGAVMVIAGLWHLVRGDCVSRWVAGLAGFAGLGYAGLLLLQLEKSLHTLGSDAMVVLRGGPGLWVVAAGSLVAFATLFLPSSDQSTLRSATEGGGLAAWAADRESVGARRWLQLGLGLIWLLDAALQFQPFMFGRGFVTKIVDPAAMGSPALIASSVTGSGQVILAHAAVFNAAFATVQLALALGLFWRRTTRAALAGTIIWGLAVWWLGESLGGLFSGMASPLTGAPGAALLYVLLAVLAWPHRPASGRVTGRKLATRVFEGRVSIAVSGLLGRRVAPVLWVLIWGGFAALMLQPQVRAPGALRAAVGGMASGQNLLASVDRSAAGLLGSAGLVPALIFAVVFAVIAIGLFVPRAARPVLVLAAVLAVAIWVIGENFGGLASGSATDPNTGPLLLLLIAAYWPRRSADGEVAQPELTGAAAEVEGESRPQREVAALAVQVPAGAAGSPHSRG
jgi:hypothetical protein